MPGFTSRLRSLQPVCLRAARSGREGPELPRPARPVAAAVAVRGGRERGRKREIDIREFLDRRVQMPRIEQSLIIEAPVDRVYAIARDVESFPDYMEDLQSTTVLERSDDGNRTITEW